MKLAPVSLLLFALMTGCMGPRYTLVPQTQPDQKTRVEQGITVVESAKKHLVSVRPTQKKTYERQRISYVVVVLNRGTEPLTLSHADVTVLMDEQPVKTYTHAELKQEIEAAAATYAALSAVYSMNAQINASMAQTHLNSALAPNATPSQSLSQLKAGMPYAQQADGYSSSAATMQTLSQTTSAQAGSLGAVLQSVVIPAGTGGGGVVTAHGVPQTGATRLKVLVAVGGESHQFEFEVSKVSK